MTTVKMHIVPPQELGDRPAIETPIVPAITGKGDTDYVCGVCGNTLMEHVRYTQVRDVVLHCSKCGATNDVEVQH